MSKTKRIRSSHDNHATFLKHNDIMINLFLIALFLDVDAFHHQQSLTVPRAMPKPLQKNFIKICSEVFE